MCTLLLKFKNNTWFPQLCIRIMYKNRNVVSRSACNKQLLKLKSKNIFQSKNNIRQTFHFLKIQLFDIYVIKILFIKYFSTEIIFFMGKINR